MVTPHVPQKSKGDDRLKHPFAPHRALPAFIPYPWESRISFPCVFGWCEIDLHRIPMGDGSYTVHYRCSVWHFGMSYELNGYTEGIADGGPVHTSYTLNVESFQGPVLNSKVRRVMENGIRAALLYWMCKWEEWEVQWLH